MIRTPPFRRCQSFCGTVAYAAQLPWILNLTVKDNIVFGRPLNSKLYHEVLKASGLEQDLEVLPGGDLTEIGVRVSSVAIWNICPVLCFENMNKFRIR